MTGSVRVQLSRPFGLPIALTALELELRYAGRRILVAGRIPWPNQQVGAITLTGTLTDATPTTVTVHLPAVERLHLAAHLALTPPASR